jgi:hypothetical protein
MGRLRVAASLMLVSAGVTALVAAQLPVLSSPAQADVAPTQPGSAFASSVVLAANPQYGGLSLVVRGGQSTASYTGTQATAASQALNLGYLGGLLNGPPNACYGGGGQSAVTAPFNALQASSANGPAITSGDDGIESVAVNPSPETAGAITNLTPITVPSLLTVTAHSSSHVNYVANQSQQATADTTMTITLLGGLVVLNGLSWSATQDTGQNDVATATFSMTSVTIAGKTTAIVTPADLTTAFASINKVLGVLGLTLIQPAETTDATTGTVTMGPLRLQVLGTAITNTVLGSLNSTETTLEEAIGKVLNANDSACFVVIAGYIGSAELVAGIVEGILAGGGVIDLDLGGASADTQPAPNFVDPLGAAESAASSSSDNDNSQTLPGFSTGSSIGGGSFLPSTGSSITPPTSAPAATVVPHSTTALSQSFGPLHCVSSSPSNRPGCWSGAATWGAASLLVIGGSLFAADIVRSRRRLSRPKETL